MHSSLQQQNSTTEKQQAKKLNSKPTQHFSFLEITQLAVFVLIVLECFSSEKKTHSHEIEKITKKY
jgi:hypothetical protein